jgi:glycerol-3-phosphate dehydrogenase
MMPRPVAPTIVGLGARGSNLERLRRERFDLLVVGGGITGAGVAWDAASRGLRVAVVEKQDVASGTSSRSTKLLHGGLRYLQQADIVLVREALHERGVIGRLAPHLVELTPFLFPIYGGWRERAKLAAGLSLYDVLAVGSGAPRHRWLGPDATRKVAPGLAEAGLDGAFVYRDAQTDDARMVVEVLASAVRHGAAVANRMAMREVVRRNGAVVGAGVEDLATGDTFQIDASVVVVAAGVWLEDIVAPRPRHPRVLPAKGVHLFVPMNGFPPDAAVYTSTTRDGRLFFIVPWLGVAMIGTTDSPYAGDLAAPVTLPEEMDYLLEATNRAFPKVHLGRDDVLATQAGLRPLVSIGARDGQPTRTLSREDRVWEPEPGIVAIAGGKLTTFRHMGQRVVNIVARRLSGPRGVGQAVTATDPLGGFLQPMGASEFEAWRNGALAGVSGSSRAFRGAAITRYGARFPVLEEMVAHDASLAAPLFPGDPTVASTRAEALYAIRHEQAGSVGDVLARRLRVALLTRDQGRSAVGEVASLLAKELGWSVARREAAVAEYDREAVQYAVPAQPSDDGATLAPDAGRALVGVSG